MHEILPTFEALCIVAMPGIIYGKYGKASQSDNIFLLKLSRIALLEIFTVPQRNNSAILTTEIVDNV